MEKDDRQLLNRTISGDELNWKPYSPWREKDRRTATRKANAAGISALSRRLMAIERARVLGKKPMDIQALELEARRWVAQRARDKQAAGTSRV